MLICFFIIVTAGLLCLTLVYALPTDRMQYHVALSADVLYEDRDNPAIVSNGGLDSVLDPSTDSRMLIIAEYNSDKSPLHAALLNEYEWFDDPISTVIYKAWSNDTDFEILQYSRYWHGYLVFLKPLLLFFSYHDIRDIMMIVQFSLAIAVIGLLGHKKQGRFIPPFVAAWLFMNPLSLCMAMQYNSVFTLTLVVLLACILLKDSALKDNKAMYLSAFAVGCLTSYFDFLTFPLVAFGIPAVYVLQRRDSEYSFVQQISFLCKAALMWMLGYILMWGSKWILADLITGSNVIEDAVAQIFVRSGLSEGESAEGYYIQVLINNFSVNKLHTAIALLAAISGTAVGVFRKNFDFKRGLPFLLAALSPLAWYFVTQNHSLGHSWFTYREVAITIFSLWTLAMAGFFEREKKSSKNASCFD